MCKSWYFLCTLFPEMANVQDISTMSDKKQFWKPGGEKPAKAGKAKEGKGKDNLNLKLGGGRAAMTVARAADPAAANPMLSKSVMSMKFMKRKADDSEELAAEANKRSRLLEGSVQWVADSSCNANAGTGASTTTSVSDSAEDTLYQMQQLNESQRANKVRAVQQLSSGASVSTGPELHCTYEKSSLYTALPGRRSFGGFNKVIEKWHSSVMDTRRQEAKYEGGGGGGGSAAVALEDEDMLKKYENLVSLPRGPSMGGKPANSHSGSGKNKKAGGGKKAKGG